MKRYIGIYEKEKTKPTGNQTKQELNLSMDRRCVRMISSLE